jgi:hypothetical protein
MYSFFSYKQTHINTYPQFQLHIQDRVQPGSSVSIVPDYGLDGWGSIPGRCRGFFPLISASRPALGPTQPPIQWLSGALSPAVKHSRGMTLTTHPLLVLRLRKSRSYTSSHPQCLHGVYWDHLHKVQKTLPLFCKYK